MTGRKRDLCANSGQLDQLNRIHQLGAGCVQLSVEDTCDVILG